MAGGRPTDYRPEFCKLVVELGKLGKSKIQMCAAMGICKRTFANWEEAHPDFLSAVNMAMIYSEDWWVTKGVDNLNAQHFQPQVYKLNMFNRFDWADKQELGGMKDKPIGMAIINAPKQMDRDSWLATCKQGEGDE